MKRIISLLCVVTLMLTLFAAPSIARASESEHDHSLCVEGFYFAEQTDMIVPLSSGPICCAEYTGEFLLGVSYNHVTIGQQCTVFYDYFYLCLYCRYQLSVQYNARQEFHIWNPYCPT